MTHDSTPHDDVVRFIRRRAARDLAHARRRMAEIKAEIERDRDLPKVTVGDLLDEMASTRRPKLRVLKGRDT
ncbi:MAG: hypothetical protein M3Q22_10845 [Actinomycetota bacterium]|nr:hypothetical protein [Actinomycetota bacterium]